MSAIIPLGIAHDPGCDCRRCLTEAFRSAGARVTETTARYRAVRTDAAASADEAGQARQRWAEARQELVLAEFALRAAEDEERAERREDRPAGALQWNPEP